MAVVIPRMIQDAPGWERHRFQFKVNTIQKSNNSQLFEVEPHPRNKNLRAQWCVQAESMVGHKNNFILSFSSKVLCPDRKNVFATVYIDFNNSSSGTTFRSFHKKWLYTINYFKKFLFTGIQKIPPNTIILVTIISETGEKPTFTDILLSDVKMKFIHLPYEKKSLTNNNSYCDESWGYSHDLQESTGNGSSSLYICNWEKFTYVFHSLKPQSVCVIKPSEVISEGSIRKWGVKLKSEIDHRGMMSFLVLVQLFSSFHLVVFVKIMYVVDYKGRTIQKFEKSYNASVGKTISYQLKNIQDVQNVVVKVSIVSDTGNHFREVHFSSPSSDDQQIENRDLDQPYFKEGPEVSSSQASAAMQKQFCSSGPTLSQLDPSDNDQPTKKRKSKIEAEGPIAPSSSNDERETENQVLDQSYFKEEPEVSNSQVQATMQKDFISYCPTRSQLDPSDSDQPTKKRKSRIEAEGTIAPSDLIGDVAGPSSCSYEKPSKVRLSNKSEFSEAGVSSSQKDKRCKTKLSDVSTLPEIDRLLDLGKWKERDHKYSVPILERFLYLYSIRMVAESSSVQQHLHHKSKPKKASGSWNVKMKSLFTNGGNSEVDIRIVATLKKSKISVLFAQMLIFVYPGMEQAKYSFEKKQCLCIGESISEDLQAISIPTTTAMVEIMILSENPDRVFTYSCKHDIDAVAGSDQSSTCHVFIQSSTDIVESDSNILSDCSRLLQAIIQNFDSEDQNRLIHMTDFSSKVIKSMLAFINGDKEVCWKRKRTEQIFKLSNKYGISELKKNCELHLMTLLSAKNALKLLVFATDNSAKKLGKAVLTFVSSRSEYFRENNRYSILQRRPEIMQRLLEYVGDNSECRTSNTKRKNDCPGKEKKKKKETEEIR